MLHAWCIDVSVLGLGFFLLTTWSFFLVMICCNHHRLQKTLTFVHLHFSVHLYYQFTSHKMQSHAFIWKQHLSISLMCCISAGWSLILYYLSYNIVGLVGLISIDFVGILHELISWQSVKITYDSLPFIIPLDSNMTTIVENNQG